MIVNSAIELYTVLLAWHLYDGFWGIFSTTGLGALPFVFIIISTLLDAYEKEFDSKQLIRILEVRLYTALFVYFIAVTPFINLYTGNTHYIEASCPADGSTAASTKDTFYGDSGTTIDQDTAKYGAMFEGSHVAQAPLWWYVFSNLNLAIANSLKFELPCRADLVSMTANLASAKITDPNLRNEAAHFNNQCWLPSANKFLAKQIKDADVLSEFRPIVENVSWFGSKYFIDTPGYYNSFRTDIGLTTVPYSTVPGEDDSVVSNGADGLGWPNCDRWWRGAAHGVGTNYGLRARLLTDLKNGAMKSSWTEWNAMSPSWFGSATDASDQLLKTALTAPGTTSPGEKLPISNSNINGGWFSAEGWINGAAGVGVMYEGAFALLEAQALKAGAPVVQAFVLMLFVIVLPLLMVLSLYDLGTLVTLTVVQFSVMFWSFLFALAYWLNNFLLSTMFGDHWLDILNSGDQPMEFMVTMWIIKFTYLVLPLIFSALLGVVGNNLGLGIEGGMKNMMHGVGAGSKTGAPKVKAMAQKAWKS